MGSMVRIGWDDWITPAGTPWASAVPAVRRPRKPARVVGGWVVPSDAAVAVGRFQADGPVGYRSSTGGPLRATRAEAEADWIEATACSCARNTDGSVTTLLCPVHADTDPCWTMARVTGKRRRGTIRGGVCTSCGHGAARVSASGQV